MSRNPALPGLHPDPAFMRVGWDNQIATSSFYRYRGVCICRSRDLMNWRPLTRALVA